MDQSAEVAAVLRYLSDHARADVRRLYRRNHEYRLEVFRHVPVHEGHLELVLEITDCSQTANDQRRTYTPGEVDEQPLELGDLHALVVGCCLPNQIYPLVRGEERALR